MSDVKHGMNREAKKRIDAAIFYQSMKLRKMDLYELEAGFCLKESSFISTRAIGWDFLMYSIFVC